jgi:fumble protein
MLRISAGGDSRKVVRGAVCNATTLYAPDFFHSRSLPIALQSSASCMLQDMLVGDIYGHDYSVIGLDENIIASSFGKVVTRDPIPLLPPRRRYFTLVPVWDLQFTLGGRVDDKIELPYSSRCCAG